MIYAKLFTNFGRMLSFFALIAFILANVAAWNRDSVFGRSEMNFFNDAIVLSLLSLTCFLDGLLHSKKL